MLSSRYTLAELYPTGRRNLFAEFSTLYQSGIAPLQMLVILRRQTPAEFKHKLKVMAHLVQHGSGLAAAGKQSNIWLSWEQRLLQAAETGGCLTAMFKHLHQHYADRVRHGRKLKARMTFPLAILVLAVFAAPIPLLFAGYITAVDYIQRTVIPLVMLFVSLWALLALLRFLCSRELSHWLSWLAYQVPLLRKRWQRDALKVLALLLEAGIPAQQALQITAESSSNLVIRGHINSACTLLANGASVSEAVIASELLADSDMQAVINSGEFAGRLDEMLHYTSQRMSNSLDIQTDLLAEWLPRVIYGLIIGFVLTRLF